MQRVNKFQHGVAFHIETRQLTFSLNQVNASFLSMKCNIGLKWVNELLFSIWNTTLSRNQTFEVYLTEIQYQLLPSMGSSIRSSAHTEP